MDGWMLAHEAHERSEGKECINECEGERVLSIKWITECDIVQRKTRSSNKVVGKNVIATKIEQRSHHQARYRHHHHHQYWNLKQHCLHHNTLTTSCTFLVLFKDSLLLISNHANSSRLRQVFGGCGGVVCKWWR